MKEKNLKWLLRLINYVIVAAIASSVTLMCVDGVVKKESKLEQLEQLILSSFIGEVDSTTLQDGAAEGMIAATGDRWSYYIPASQMESYENGKKNSYVGIGVSISTVDMKQGLQVLTVEPNGGAALAGILPGDLIIAVDGTSCVPANESHRPLILGDEGTTVNVTVLRGSERLDFILTMPRSHTQHRVSGFG